MFWLTFSRPKIAEPNSFPEPPAGERTCLQNPCSEGIWEAGGFRKEQPVFFRSDDIISYQNKDMKLSNTSQIIFIFKWQGCPLFSQISVSIIISAEEQIAPDFHG